MRKKLFLVLLFVISLLVSALALQGIKTQTRKKLPSPLPGGGFLLPNGWTITPTDKQIQVGDLPLGMAPAEDGNYLLVTNNGDGTQTLAIIDTRRQEVVDTVRVDKSFLGICYSAQKKQIYLSGGGDNKILIYNFSNGKASSAGAIDLETYPNPLFKTKDIFPAGIALHPKENKLYIANNLNNTLAVADTESRKVVAAIPVGAYPYKCVVAPDGKQVYVSNWGSATISIIDTASGHVISTIKVGDHPNDLLLDSDGKRLFVANANVNTVSVIDVAKKKVVETISVALYPKAPQGSTPNALALSADGRTLYVANADNNCVAVVQVPPQGHSRILGLIPVGWYPTAVALSRDGKTLYVANGKGVASKPNPKGPNPYEKTTPATEFIGKLLIGTVSVIEVPEPQTLARYTQQVYDNSPYRDQLLVRAEGAPPGNPIPDKPGKTSPIRYVIYIIKENRTYDQVFGDMPEGNGDPSLTLFGEKVTPNHHALAREFVLMDNFYVDAEVSADGHNWSMAAYATDYVEKTWPTHYSQRGRKYDYEGSASVAFPTPGYIWDQCARHKVSYRSYGEFIEAGGTPQAMTRVPALKDHFDLQFRGFDLSYSDQDRLKEWTREFRAFEAKGNLPRLQIVRLPNDHTAGTRAGSWTPRAMVADNDLALGKLVEVVSHSKYWKETAIFVLEDDAQNGPDHVDAHRSVALVISPYTKRKFVDSTMYCTCSVLRTMELILGLPPMSQFDAAATPMFNAFADQPDLTPYTARPAQVPLDERNTQTAYKAQRSMELTLDVEDAAPDVEFNEIIWKAVKGEHSEMPSPVRSAFVHERPK